MATDGEGMDRAGVSITSLETVLDLAIWLETAGQEFYAAARRELAAPQLDALLARLGVEEQRHAEVYRRLYERCLHQPAPSGQPLGEYGLFLDLMRREITRQLTVEPGVTPAELLERALRFERDSLLYFHEIAALFPGGERGPIDAICAEERHHIRELLAIRHRLSEGESG